VGLPISAISKTERLVFLDWVRILAFAILVFFHVGMYYVSWDFHIKSPHASTLLEPWLFLSAPWRMDLLFMVSGAATSFMLLRDGATGRLLRLRARRLLIPLLFGILVVVPPQSWLEVVQKYHYTGSYADFWGLYLAGYKGFCPAVGKCLILPTWNHLWFLPYLFLYTLLLWLALRPWPALLDWLGMLIGKVLQGPGLLVWPTLYLALTLLLLRISFPQNYAVWGDWFAHSQYLAMFILGAALARVPARFAGTSRDIWRQMVQWRWMALALALVAWLTLVLAAWLAREAQLPMRSIAPWAYSVQQWCAIVAAFGFAQVHLNRDGPARRYLTEAVFPVYILHQTLILLLAHSFAPLALNPVLEGSLLVGLTFALSLAGFEMVRRVPWLRPLFGLAAKAI
jgi:glucans biosynthesis protein C